MTSKEEVYASVESLLADATPAAKQAFERLAEDYAFVISMLKEHLSENELQTKPVQSVDESEIDLVPKAPGDQDISEAAGLVDGNGESVS